MELVVTANVSCPHCGETFPVGVDTSQREQDLIEDCSICCRPIAFTIRCRPGEIVEISAAN
jgi:hypothetical protein